jgi:hypothetical protein
MINLIYVLIWKEKKKKREKWKSLLHWCNWCTRDKALLFVDTKETTAATSVDPSLQGSKSV